MQFRSLKSSKVSGRKRNSRPWHCSPSTDHHAALFGNHRGPQSTPKSIGSRKGQTYSTWHLTIPVFASARDLKTRRISHQRMCGFDRTGITAIVRRQRKCISPLPAPPTQGSGLGGGAIRQPFTHELTWANVASSRTHSTDYTVLGLTNGDREQT